MKIFPAVDYPQGGPLWWELRRGIVTASGCDKIITPKTMRPSAQADDYMDELIGDLVNLSPNWFSEKTNKPPNRAIEEGIVREQESRRWFGLAYDLEILEVGFCLADCGKSGFSPDGLVDFDGAYVGLELKNPLLKTQARYLREGGLPAEYKSQVHAQILFGDLAGVFFVSYAPPLPPLVVRVEPDKFTDALAEAVAVFHQRYEEARVRLGLPADVFKRPDPARQTAVKKDEPAPF